MFRQKMMLSVGALLFMALVYGCQVAVQAPVASLRWRTLAQGKAEAKELQLPCLVDFYIGSECPRCQALDKDVYGNSQIVVRINHDFIPVRIHLDQELSAEEQSLMELMESGGECILLFLNPAGEVIKNQQGKRICTMSMISPEQFLDYLEQAKKQTAVQQP